MYPSKKKKRQLKDFYVKLSIYSITLATFFHTLGTHSVTLSTERTKCMSLPLGKGHLIYKLVAGSSPNRSQRTLIETAVYSYMYNLFRAQGREMYSDILTGPLSVRGPG